ncbi:MAG: hypothetical protein OXI37_07800 [Gammaproteobacteria bacterium]|nr:hypothetical protein [Gammaproteobacteria bacterium]
MRNEFGCTGGSGSSRRILDAPVGNLDELQAVPTGYEFHFGPGPHNPDGTFKHGAWRQ